MLLQVLRTRRAKGGQSFRRTATREEPSMRSPRFSSLVVRSRMGRSITPVYHAGGPHRTTSKISSMRLYGLVSVKARPHVLHACKDDCLADGQCSWFYSRRRVYQFSSRCHPFMFLLVPRERAGVSMTNFVIIGTCHRQSPIFLTPLRGFVATCCNLPRAQQWSSKISIPKPRESQWAWSNAAFSREVCR